MDNHGNDNVIPFENMNDRERNESTLEVINVKYLGNEYTNDEGLFRGYKHLKAVTFSYNLGFISEILHYFDTAEIIIGCEWRAKYEIHEIAAFQQETLQIIRRNKYLLERMEKDEVKFWLSDEFLIHSKFYILTDDCGIKSRIITGSPNFSRRAFSGNQREHIEKFDNDSAALNSFDEEFENMKVFCTQEVIRESVFIGKHEDPDNPKNIPIIHEALVKEAGIIVEQATDKEEIAYATDLSRLERKYESVFPKVDKKGTTILLKPKKINELFRKYKAEQDTKLKKMEQFPVLHLDLESETIQMNTQNIELTADKEMIRSDIQCLLEFFDNYKDFIGDAQKDQKTYYMLLNYMFLSIFTAELRYAAHITGENIVYFPMYAIIWGKKSAGKSSFVETIHQLMYGSEICSYSADQFTASKVRGLLTTTEGVVAHFDDLDQNRFRNHGAEIIKDEKYLIDQNHNHPTVIITTNNIASLKKELAKRVYYAKISITQDDMAAAAKKRKMVALRKKMTTSLYHEYLRRMMPLVNVLLQRMYDTNPGAEWHPDIFQLSSQVFISILQEYDIEVPDYFCELKYEDYFGADNDIKRDVKQNILFQWEHNRKAFKVNRKQNVLKYTAGDYSYEADRVCDSLPEYLEAQTAGCDVIMKLDKAEEFFGIRFKTGKLWW